MNIMRRRVWDTGPYRTVEKPPPPKLGDGEDPNGVPHRIALESYEADYRAWAAAERQFQRERADFERHNGQAVELDVWSVDGGEMLGNDPRRYRATLPSGLTPGANVGVSRKIL